jgi:hypothetical protein
MEQSKDQKDQDIIEHFLAIAKFNPDDRVPKMVQDFSTDHLKLSLTSKKHHKSDSEVRVKGTESGVD